MIRDIIEIDALRCAGCGHCIPACPEGAVQLVNGKASLVSDLMCDGIGACTAKCPTGALTLTRREAEFYDERRIMVNIIKGGDKVIKAHLQHMLNHKEIHFYNTAVEVLKEQNIPIPDCVITAPSRHFSTHK